MIDTTSFILSVLGIVLLLISIYIVPSIKKLIENNKHLKQLDILIKISKNAVMFVEEDFFTEKGVEKRKQALDFIKTELNKYKLTFDEETINAYLSSAVKEFIRTNN